MTVAKFIASLLYPIHRELAVMHEAHSQKERVTALSAFCSYDSCDSVSDTAPAIPMGKPV